MLNLFRNRSVDNAVDEAIADRSRMDSLSEKRAEELDYWIKRKNEEGTLHASWYEYFYTEHFGLGVEDYAGLRVLDIGCGPRGSLEWAENAAERIGLDPLADDYRKLRPEGYQMEMIASGSESIPFADGHFDIVASFNSLDHVDDLDETISEIKRVVCPGGYFLLLTDVNHKATLCEPIEFGWEIAQAFTDVLEIVEEQRLEKPVANMYQSIRSNIPYDMENKTQRYGVTSLKFRKPLE